MSEPYASKMYLISPSEYANYLELKKKETNEQNVEMKESATPAEQQSSREPTQTNETVNNNNEETGTGKTKAPDIALAEFNDNFIKKQNLKRFLENSQWEKLYERILPLFKRSLQNTSNKSTQSLNNSFTEKDKLLQKSLPNLYGSDDESDDARGFSKSEENLSPPKTPFTPFLFTPDDEAVVKKKERKKRASTNKYKQNNIFIPNPSPSGPSKSTRHQKNKRKNDEQERTGTGLKKFRAWATFKL